MIREQEERDLLTPEQLAWAAEYVRRFRGWHPDDKIAAENDIRGTLYNSLAARAAVMAVLSVPPKFNQDKP